MYGDRSLVVVTVYPGQGEAAERVAVELDELITRETFEPLEMSNAPFSLMLAGFGRKESYTVTRRKRIDLREEVAERIAHEIKATLLRAFSARDQNDGYPLEREA